MHTGSEIRGWHEATKNCVIVTLQTEQLLILWKRPMYAGLAVANSAHQMPETLRALSWQKKMKLILNINNIPPTQPRMNLKTALDALCSDGGQVHVFNKDFIIITNTIKPRILTCYHCVRSRSSHSPQTLANLWGTQPASHVTFVKQCIKSQQHAGACGCLLLWKVTGLWTISA